MHIWSHHTAFYARHSVAAKQQRHQFMHNNLSVKCVILHEIRLANESDFSLHKCVYFFSYSNRLPFKLLYLQFETLWFCQSETQNHAKILQNSHFNVHVNRNNVEIDLRSKLQCSYFMAVFSTHKGLRTHIIRAKKMTKAEKIIPILL